MEVKIVKSSQNSIMRKVIAVMLLLTLTMVDFALIGIEAVSYAVDVLSDGTVTNNKNVTFDTYFKDENGVPISIKEENISKNDLKLYARVSVKNEGYFNGTIELGASNFKLKNEKTNNIINKIENNIITLNQINSGEAVELEIGIESIKDDTISSGLLNMKSEVILKGIYRNSEERDINIAATRNVQLKLTSGYAENEGAEIASKIISNKVYEVNGEKKRIVQVLVESGLKENRYPIKENNIEVSVPEGVEEVKVHAREQLATNGKLETEFNDSNYKYIQKDYKVNISIKNEVENGNIRWIKNGKDRIVVTYIMSDKTNLSGAQIVSKTSIKLYDEKATTKEATTTSKILEEVDGAIETGIELEETSIYKGKIYSGETREYKENAKIYINKAGIEKNAEVEMMPAKYETANGDTNANIQYVSTTVKKSDIERILGAEGKLTIVANNGTVVELSKDIEANENGDITVTYPNGITSIKVTATKGVKEGTIIVKNTKAIKENGVERADKKAYTGIKESITGAEAKIELKETETKAELNINKTTLSTLRTNENVEITATLVTNSEKYDLFKNPTYEIRMPNAIKNMNIKTMQPLYAEMFSVKEATITTEDNGSRVLRVALEGEQTNYTTAVNQTTIVIVADVEFEMLTPSNTSAITMNYSNENGAAEQYTEKKDVRVESKYGLMIYTTMENFNNQGDVITTMDDEVTKGKLETGNEAKEAYVKATVINNYDDAMENVSIIGRIPTEGLYDGTLNTTMAREVKTSIADAEILYSTDANAKAGDNVWSANRDGAKAFKINIPRFEKGAKAELEYAFVIPQNVDFGQSAYAKIDVDYAYLGNQMTQTSVLGAETEKLTSIPVAELKEAVVRDSGAGLVANIGTTTAGRELKDGDNIYEGQAVEYTVQITNNTGNTLKNVKISVEQENGAMYGLKGTEIINPIVYKDTELHIEHRHEELDTDKKEFDIIENFENGKTLRFKYEIVVNQVDGDANTQGQIKIKADNFEEKSFETISNKIEQAELKINYKYFRFDEVKIYSGSTLETQLTIENITDKNLKNVKGKISLPAGVYGNDDLYACYRNTIEDTRLQNVKYNQEDNTITFEVSEIEPGVQNRINALFYMNVKEFEAKELELTFVAEAQTAENTYYSNQMVKNYYNVQKDVTIEQTTNTDLEKALQDGEEFSIVITAKNNTDKNILATIADDLPSSFVVKNATLEKSNSTQEIKICKNVNEKLDDETSNYIVANYNGSKLNVTEKFKEHENIKIVLNIKVDTHTSDETIKNKAILKYGETEEDGRLKYLETKESEIEYNIKPLEIVDEIEYIEIEQTSNVENKSTLRDGQEVVYTAKVKNISKENVEISVNDILPNGINAKQVFMNNENITAKVMSDENTLNLEKEKLVTSQEIDLKIVTNYNENDVAGQELSNVIKVITPENTVLSNPITYYAEMARDKTPEPQDNPEPQQDPKPQQDPNTQENPETPSNSVNKNSTNNNSETSKQDDTKYTISGLVWLDENKNGQREHKEQLVQGIEVKIVDIDTGKFVQENGSDLKAITTEKGEYNFIVQRGNYVVVFMYDTTKYGITQYKKAGVSANQNSDAIGREIQVDGTNYDIASTDIVKVISEDIENIDVGLLENTKFDFELKKYVSEVTVNTSKETKTYNYDNAELAKVEIHAKELENAKVLVKYTIRVTNNGEIEGYVKDIADYIPTSLDFNSELNTDWYQANQILHNTSLVNTKIRAGETKDVTVILTKTMTESNTGLISNLAELIDVSNEVGANDLDSTPGNKAKGEDDLGKADLIISVKTGALVMYIGIILTILVIIGAGAYIINKMLFNKNNINEDFDI